MPRRPITKRAIADHIDAETGEVTEVEVTHTAWRGHSRAHSPETGLLVLVLAAVIVVAASAALCVLAAGFVLVVSWAVSPAS